MRVYNEQTSLDNSDDFRSGVDMRQNRTVCTALLVMGLIFLLSSMSFAVTRPAVQRTITPTPTVQPQPGAIPVLPAHSMAIQNISLTSQCQLKFIVRNTGPNLTADQHKNSSIKIGREQPVSLAVFDPASRLRTGGQSITNINNQPLTKGTNITIVVTLYNGKKTTMSKFLQPTCPPPTVTLPGKAAAAPSTQITAVPALTLPQPAPKPITAEIKPIALPETILQVKELGGDLEKWSNYGATDTSLPRMDFRWKSSEKRLKLASWQASISQDFPYVIASGPVGPLPPPGVFGRFSIDLSPLAAKYTKPVTFYFRVKPVKLTAIEMATSGGSASGATIEAVEPSPPVRVVLTEAGSGPITEFNLPKRHLQVVFEKVYIRDDSDDLSGGDLSFKFTVNGETKWKHFADDQCDTDETHNLGNLSITVADPPNIAPMTIYGCDNDDDSGAFTASGDHCGDSHDSAAGNFDIRTYLNMERWNIPVTPFKVDANGSKLKFQVSGHYSLYCSPCPQGVQGPLLLEVVEPPPDQ